jgi:hypothetical protein
VLRKPQLNAFVIVIVAVHVEMLRVLGSGAVTVGLMHSVFVTVDASKDTISAMVVFITVYGRVVVMIVFFGGAVVVRVTVSLVELVDDVL